jgi:DNA topoisomerase VI subunit B
MSARIKLKIKKRITHKVSDANYSNNKNNKASEQIAHKKKRYMATKASEDGEHPKRKIQMDQIENVKKSITSFTEKKKTGKHSYQEFNKIRKIDQTLPDSTGMQLTHQKKTPTKYGNTI